MGEMERSRAGCGEKTGPRPCFHFAFGKQAIVRFDDRRLGDFLLFGEASDGREPCTRRGGDPLADDRHGHFGTRDPLVAVECAHRLSPVRPGRSVLIRAARSVSIPYWKNGQYSSAAQARSVSISGV